TEESVPLAYCFTLVLLLRIAGGGYFHFHAAVGLVAGDERLSGPAAALRSRGDRLVAVDAPGRDVTGRDAVADQVVPDRVGAALRQAQVVLAAADAIG